MGLFSRRTKPGRDESPATEVEPGEQVEAPDVAPSIGAEAPLPDAAGVGISMSTFRGVGATTEPSEPPRAADAAPPARGVPAEAPEPTESLPGVYDNVLLRDALAALPDPPTPGALMNVARQLLQGHIYLRVKGDARALLSEGKGLPLAVTRRGDKQHVLVYSSGAALRKSVTADGDQDTSAVAQPILTVLRHVLDGAYEGIVVDPSSAPARAVLPKPLLQRAVDEAHPSLTIKTLLAGPRSGDTPAAIAASLTDAPLWIAVRRTEGGGPVGIAESRTADGERYLELYSHPLEVLSLGRGDQPLPVTTEQLGKALGADPDITGVLVDPGGPWIRVSRADLATLIPVEPS